jgi:sugar fermentation stimulation protein A
MKYPNIVPGIFLKRPNRFIAHVLINGRQETAHVKNTGRCRELLIPGTRVYLQEHDNPSRKTRLSLIAVEKGKLLVNIDSQAPNKVMREALSQGLCLPGLKGPVTCLKPESVYGGSRFDFFVAAGEQKAYLEIKGVTLELDGVAKFPDAPTERGVKHIRELMEAAREGFSAYVVFILQMKGMRYITPNDETHKEFGQALREAHKAGVRIIAYDCLVSPDEMTLDKPASVVL